mgnify:CR=1 FL=1
MLLFCGSRRRRGCVCFAAVDGDEAAAFVVRQLMTTKELRMFCTRHSMATKEHAALSGNDGATFVLHAVFHGDEGAANVLNAAFHGDEGAAIVLHAVFYARLHSSIQTPFSQDVRRPPTLFETQNMIRPKQNRRQK